VGSYVSAMLPKHRLFSLIFCISSHDNFLAAPDEYGRVVFVEYPADYVETIQWLDLGV
jgi:hypothetical protein